jgi:hypothetical protein
MVGRSVEINLGTNENFQNEMMHILKAVMEQNYFQFEQKYYKQTDVQAMDIPASPILAEAYIQNIKH